MKSFFIVLLSLMICSQCRSQENNYSFYQLYQLDSIGHSPSIAKHFGDLYYHFLLLVEEQLKRSDTTTERLVRNFETVFAKLFIDACLAYKNGEEIKLPEWRKYFSDSNLQSIQYDLLGANAHLNGGLAAAIKGSYTSEEWKSIKKKYYLFNICLNKTYKYIYEKAVNENKKARLLGILTFGLDKFVGNLYLYKWRKRQMRLVEYSFDNSPKYTALLNKINHQKDKIDKMVITQF